MKESLNPIEETLFSSRNIFLTGMVNGEMAQKINAQLLAMEKADSQRPIVIWINSPGGEVYSGFAIYDMIQFITPKVFTVVSGSAASMGSVIALAADKENRYALPNAKFLLHQPLVGGTIQGPASDLEIHAKDIIDLKNRMFKLYSERTGTPEKKYRDMMERDRWVYPEEAIELGLISKIIRDRAELEGLMS